MKRRIARDLTRGIEVRLVNDFSWDLLKRLLANITIRGSCWIRGNDQSIYTTIKDGSRFRQAHRVSYEIFTGKRLEHLGCHTCDVPACINPEHIFDGTASQNRQDSVRKGRASNIKIESRKERLSKRKLIHEQQMIHQGTTLSNEYLEKL